MVIKRKTTLKRRRGAKQPVLDTTAVARPWSDLPDDILELVTDKMSITDLTRFRFVCKNWNLFKKSRPLPAQHPWLLCYDDNGYRLYQPFSNVKICKSDFYNFKDFRVCASKKGWLLLSSPANDIIAYSPFTKKTIILPPIKLKSASFSTSPSDPDCVFFTFNEDPLTSTTTIGIWKQKEANWGTMEFAGTHLLENIIFSSGLFFCSNYQGVIGLFSIQDRLWRIVEKTTSIFKSFVKPCDCESHLVEFNGRIFLVILRMLERWNFVFEFSLREKKWVSKCGLSDVAIFVNGSVAIGTAACVTKSKDRVYYIKEGSECRFYCLLGGKRRNYKYVKPYNLLGPNEQGCKKLWIEPPSFSFS